MTANNSWKQIPVLTNPLKILHRLRTKFLSNVPTAKKEQLFLQSKDNTLFHIRQDLKQRLDATTATNLLTKNYGTDRLLFRRQMQIVVIAEVD